MDETSLDDLREELATLEATETRISAERRRLHDQIDYGYATAATRARERDVSDERRQLHRRIDALREVLDARDHTAGADQELVAPEPLRSRLSEWSGVTPDIAPVDNPSAEEYEL